MPDALAICAVALLASPPPALGVCRHSAEAGRFSIGRVRKKICRLTREASTARMGQAAAVKNTPPYSRHIPSAIAAIALTSAHHGAAIGQRMGYLCIIAFIKLRAFAIVPRKCAVWRRPAHNG